MTTPNVTSSTDSQMPNNIMAAGSRDRPPMLATGRYPQWNLRFLRYIDTRPNSEALRKCILSSPYKPTSNNLRTSSNSRNKNVDTTPRYKSDDHSRQFGNQRTVNVAGTREKVGSPVYFTCDHNNSQQNTSLSKICALDKNFSSIWTYTTMMLLRVRNHHREDVYIRDLVDFDVTINFAKKESMKKAFQDMLHELGEVNTTHAYCNGSRTSKDNKDPIWNTSFKTKSTQKTTSALEDFI
nr:hypothetical protein [Tanacetum cinerariifolium]